MLSFRKNEIIKLINPTPNANTYIPQGWLKGVLNNRRGLFPVEYVRPLTRADMQTLDQHQNQQTQQKQSQMNECFGSIEEEPVRLRPSDVMMSANNNNSSSDRNNSQANGRLNNKHDHNSKDPAMMSVIQENFGYVGNELDAGQLQKAPQQDGHYSMMEFAMMNFKQSIDKYDLDYFH